MHEIDYFKNESSIHAVSIENYGFSIKPRGKSKEHLHEFQNIAKEALRFSSEEFSVIAHPDRPPYDLIYFKPINQ